MLCPKCGTTLPEEGDCLSCGEARPNLHVPPPPATDPGAAPARSVWRELGPVTKVICILLGIGLTIPVIWIVKEVKWWLVPGNTFVIENQSGQLISTATISIMDGPGQPEERGTVRFESVPVGGERSGSVRKRVHWPAIFIKGRLADGMPFSGFTSDADSDPYRIIIRPRGEIVFGEPVPARDK